MIKKIVIFGNGHNTIKANNFYVNKHIADFLFDLADKDYDISFIQPSLVEKQLSSLNTTTINKNINVLSLDKRSISSAVKVFKEILNADFIYIFYPSSWANLVAILAYLLRVPYGLYIRSLIKTDSIICKFVMNQSKVSNSVQGIGQQLSKLFVNVQSIRPMTNTLKFKERSRKDNNNKSKLNVLFVGRTEKVKGIFELLDATKKLNINNRDIALKIVGEGKDHIAVKNFSMINPNIDISIEGLINNSEKIIKFYNWADILILPTYYEGFPRVLFEAGAMGVTLISTSVGGIPYVMSPNKDYIEIVAKDSYSIYLAIKKLQNNPKLLNQLSQASAKFAINLYNDSKTHNELLLDYLKVMK
jgi:glycosyltransferase involved in cell wall biosynthesis